MSSESNIKESINYDVLQGLSFGNLQERENEWSKKMTETDTLLEIEKNIRDEIHNRLVLQHDRLEGKFSKKLYGVMFYKLLIANGYDALQSKVQHRENGFTISCDNKNVIKGIVGPINKIFTYFDNLDNLYGYTVCLQKGQIDNRTYYEVIEDHHNCKIYFDIDMKEKLEMADDLMISVLKQIRIEMLRKITIYEHKNHTLVFESHSEKKKSFHIIIDGFYFENNMQVKQFFKNVRKNIPEIYQKYLDEAVYTKNRSFRMYKSHKLDDVRIKEITYRYDTYHLRDQRKIFEASLITNTNQCTSLLPYEICQNTFINDEIQNHEWNTIYKLWKKFPNSKSYKFTPGHTRVEKIADGYCPCLGHERVHHGSNGGYLYVKNGELYFNCLSIPSSSIYLGQINTKDLVKEAIQRKKINDSLVINDEIITEEKDEWIGLTYNEMKLKFEKTFFKCISRGVYYEINDDRVTVRNKTEMENCYMHLKYPDGKNKGSFIGTWINDERIRKYEFVELLPPPIKCPKNTYNLFNGWRIQNININDSINKDDQLNIDQSVQFVFEHFKLVFGTLIDYVLDYFTYYLKYPGKNPKIALLLKSLEGLGKGAIIDLFTFICGSQYILLCESVERDIFGQFNQLLEGVLLLGIDEMELKTAIKFESRLKDMITNPKIIINPKGCKPYKIDNRLHIISFSNKEWPWTISESNRRYLPIDSTSIKIPERSYFEKLYECYANDAVVQQVYIQFMERDISNFNPVNMPATDFGEDLKILSRSIELSFMIDFIQSLTPGSIRIVTSKELFDYYLIYISENTTNIKVVTTSIKFNMKIKALNIDGIENKKGMKGNYKNIDVDQALEWCVNKNYISMDC